jgi:uncharacterized membrane protein YidH (DUF202 family)
MGTRAIAERAAVAVEQMDDGNDSGGNDSDKNVQQPAAAGGRGPVVAGALAGIATYIPSEAIGFYVAGFALLNLTDNNQQDKWLLLSLTIVLNGYFAVLQIMTVRDERDVQASTRHKRRQVVTAVLLTTVALCVYIAALPANPFLGAGKITLQWAGVLALALALILPSMTRFLGLEPRK